MAKTDNMSLLIEKIKMSLLEAGKFRNPLMSFSAKKKKIKVNKKNLDLTFGS